MHLVQDNASDAFDILEDKHRQSRFQLAKLLRCTEEMLICAQNGDWESVEEMEIARKEELAACFIENSNEESEVVVQALAALIHMNKKIMELVKAARAGLVEDRHQLQQKKSAIQQYEMS